RREVGADDDVDLVRVEQLVHGGGAGRGVALVVLRDDLVRPPVDLVVTRHLRLGVQDVEVLRRGECARQRQQDADLDGCLVGVGRRGGGGGRGRSCARGGGPPSGGGPGRGGGPRGARCTGAGRAVVRPTGGRDEHCGQCERADGCTPDESH